MVESLVEDGRQDPGPGGGAELRHGSQVWTLPPGRSLTFGRSRGCDIVLAHEPEDLLVSRHAGTLSGAGNGVLVTNASQRHPLLLQPIPGQETVLAPGMTVGTMPHARARVQVAGAYATRYLIYIDSTSLLGPQPGTRPPPEHRVPGRPTASAYHRMDLLPAQRRYLAALCEPILARVGEKAPPSYQAIADRCGASPRTVRNSLDQLRQVLSNDFGVPGLQSDDGPGGHSLPALSRWGVDSGNVTLADLDLLE
jgi:hypothetical protein